MCFINTVINVTTATFLDKQDHFVSGAHFEQQANSKCFTQSEGKTIKKQVAK